MTRQTLRDPKCERRSCDIFPAQFDQVMEAHRAPWNRFPNPMFELDHITTGCVAVAMSMPDGEAAYFAKPAQTCSRGPRPTASR